VDRCSFSSSDSRFYLSQDSPRHAAPYKGGVAFKIAANAGLDLVSDQPNVLQLVI
jgi:hypothetical protein